MTVQLKNLFIIHITNAKQLIRICNSFILLILCLRYLMSGIYNIENDLGTQNPVFVWLKFKCSQDLRRDINPQKIDAQFFSYCICWSLHSKLSSILHQKWKEQNSWRWLTNERCWFRIISFFLFKFQKKLIQQIVSLWV
jgi:hypothetical protein